MCPVLLWQPALPQAGQFGLLAADIGQGNAVLVRTAQHALLYEVGPRLSQDSGAGHRVLLPLLEALQTRLDRVVLSHCDIGHIGGAATVLTMQPQASWLCSIEDAYRLQAIRRAQRCVAGQSCDWDGVRFDIRHPKPLTIWKDPHQMPCLACCASAMASVPHCWSVTWKGRRKKDWLPMRAASR
jgi:competence protein ComEC